MNKKFLKLSDDIRINLKNVDYVRFYCYEGSEPEHNTYEAIFLRATAAEPIVVRQVKFNKKEEYEQFKTSFDLTYVMELKPERNMCLKDIAEQMKTKL